MSDHSQPSPTSGSQAHDDEHGGVGKFVGVFIALIVLTIISFVAGSSEAIMSTPEIGWTIMMAVSCAKALLVMMFFMHLIWEANWKYVLTIPATVMSIFLLLMLFPDIGRRTENYSDERWLYAARPDAVRLELAGGEVDATEGETEEETPSH